MRNLTGTLCLTLAVLFGSGEARGADLPVCEGSPSHGSVSIMSSWDSCKGIYISSLGNRYDGEWRGGKPHGKLIVTWSPSAKNLTPGGIYDGEWRDGKHHGYGSYTYATGDKYTGDYIDGKRHGLGTYTWANGDKYIGEFRYSVSNGEGIFTHADGRVKEGIWKNGKFQYAQKVSPTVTTKRPLPPSKSAAEKENERLREEIARLKGKPETPSLTDSSNIQEAKKECSELGFKAGTEKFGECVLQLTE